jgi:hypothetical protein
VLLDQLEPERWLRSLAYAKAAEVCGCPVGIIRSRFARARDDLDGVLAGRREQHRLTPARTGTTRRGSTGSRYGAVWTLC